MPQILCGNKIIRTEPIAYGWSDDSKYYAETEDGRKYLLRLSDISLYERKKAEFIILSEIYSMGFRTSMPLDRRRERQDRHVAIQ